MEENNKSNEATQNDQRKNISGNTDASGLHQKNPPKGADKMNESFSKPASGNAQPGDSSRYANTSDNEG